VLKEQTVNSEFYKKVMDQLLKRLWRIRPDMAHSGNWFLQHSNALSNNATISKQFLEKKKVTVLDHSPLLTRFGTCRLLSIP
jgi:pyridoxine/pyridoxamine 5'-phosphate oxidase